MTKKVTSKDLLITFKNFDKQHLRNLAKQEKVINEIYIKALNDAIMSSAFVKGNEADSDKPLNWAHYPLASKQLDKAIAEYVGKLETAIKEGNQREWMLSVKKNNEVIDHLTKNGKITKEQVEAWKSPNIDALEAFQQRKNEKGMNLSDRVWKVGKQMRQELELALELGIGEGKSAADLSKDVRKYLKQPDKLFRRVRDKYGNLRLSKAAAAYHPGQGVYRSSYKNAMRMTTSENNMAYRASDHQKWQGLDFVIGYKVQLSNNHTVNDKPLKDICDKLQGDYPKNFNFKGWHPFCRCFATPILASWEEQLKVMKMKKDGQNVSNYKYKGEIHDVPQNFKDWISENSDRIQRAKSKPYFIQDNYKDGNIKNGLDLTNNISNATSSVHVRSREEILADADKRHKQRTAEQVKAIQDRWDERTLTNEGLASVNYKITAPNIEYKQKIRGTLLERAEAMENNIIQYNGKNSDIARQVIDIRNADIDIIDRYNAIADLYKRKVDDKLYSYKSYEAILHLKEIQEQDNVVIASKWKSTYKQLIEEINNHDFDNGYKPIVGKIEHLYNIYQLSKNSKVRQMGFDNVSDKTPCQIFTDFENVVQDFYKYAPKKAFFDSLDHFVPMYVVDKGGAFYNPNNDSVIMSLTGRSTQRLIGSVWYRSGRFYHEFGHAKDYHIKLYESKEVEDAFKKWKKEVKANGVEYYKNLRREVNDNWQKYGNRREDVDEQLCAYIDCLQAIMPKNDTNFLAHQRGYYANDTLRHNEFLAHCSEAYWGGNAVIQAIDPQLYNLMMKLGKLF